ncbi:chorion class B protein Ld34-like [Spodoptera frugiperda]|uniref:Chorion class B protein Ld34-like n=1 Tax=Spodoptera frugiperda TaxID=7108 RepID=A0A9R0DIW5_SPOFR|nr:chorion class B protein Ld34-like [Spodoptera frugiperda]
MAAKVIALFCVQALLIQSAFSQCLSRTAVDASGIPYNTGFGYDGFSSFNGGYPGWGGRGLMNEGFYSPAMEFTATSGGALPVTSSSSMAPVGISIVSDNAFEGALSVAGQLPFVGTTAMEGVLPTSGAGAINHGCGNGVNAMSALSATSSPASVVTDAYPGALAYDGLYTNRIAPGFGSPALAYNEAILPGRVYNGVGYNSAVDTMYSPAVDAFGYPSAGDALEFTPTSGGALPVSSASAIPPTGIAVASDNAYEGALEVIGELPFVGTVAMEGVVPSAGAGAVNHACGNGRTAMASGSAAYAPGAAYAPAAVSPFTAYGPAPGFAPGFSYPGRFGCGL